MKSLRKPLGAFFSLFAASALAAFGTTGCQTDAFCWDNCPGDVQNSGSSSGSANGGAGGAGGGGLGGEGGCGIFGCMTSSSSGSGGSCVPTNGGIEICDGLDNDCNNKVDDSPDINFGSPKTCGTCDNNCYTQLTNTDPAGIGCNWDMTPGKAGTCTCGACAEGWYDFDGDCKCTYYCVKSANDDTLCNNKDDDCDGTNDEDVDLCKSTTDCGACGNNCVVLNGTPTCETTAMPGQACTPANTKCAIGSCNAGYYDLDGSAATGCEYKCDPTNLGIETCDGMDNDCDGLIDNADDLTGDPKFDSFCRGDEPLYRGICGLIANGGKYACVDAKWKCVGPNVKEPGQVPETCNGQDDDCDGSIDDSPGDVGMACGVTNVYPCQKGTIKCINGAPQCDGAKDPVAETCNNVDDDCNGTIDDNVPGFGVQCGPMVDTGACAFGTTQCQPGGIPACVGAVLPTSETCNNIDDDCDGMIDDVSGVGASCGTSNTMPCKFGTIQCVGANLACVGNIEPKSETCNMIDDDCDGTVDEGLPPQQCLPMGANPNLVYGGSSQCRRGTQACGGACTGYIGPSTEVCDAIDNDCDGAVDDNLTLGPCNVPTPPPAGATSPCQAGTFVCTGGVQTCQGSVGPTSSVDACGVDSNCDGTLTGQPNLMTDVANCGTCGNNCYNGAVFSVWGCVGGACVFQGCQNGYYDLDNNNTCEYACSFKSAQEACNGQDDNCNGAVDENPTKPTPAQICGVSPTSMRPECTTNVNVSCVAGAWQCSFPAGVCPGGCSSNDEICDTLDNDCDGLVNENVPNFGQPCASDDSAPGTQGVCRTTGTYQCATTTTTSCNATKNNALATDEACDGADNDCDGSIDETYQAKGTDMTRFVKPAVTKIASNRWIYSYEASRPTSTTITPGSGNGYQSSAPMGTTLDKTKACSAPNRLPWFNVTPTEVEQTCSAMGGFICQTTEWTTACQASQPCAWGYNPRGAACQAPHMFSATKRCNLGPTYDFNSMLAGDQDGLLPTGSSTLLPNCWSDWSGLQGNAVVDNKIYDITGNLREITKSGTNYPLVGGAYNTADVNGATCNFTFYTTTNASFQLYDLGFRCCFSQDPRL